MQPDAIFLVSSYFFHLTRLVIELRACRKSDARIQATQRMEDLEATFGFAFYNKKLYRYQSKPDVTFYSRIFQCFCCSKSKICE